MSKGGAKPYSMMFQVIIHQLIVQAEELRSPYRMIVQDIIQQLVLWAKAGRSPYRMIAQDIIQQLTLWAKAGRNPKRNTAQGNTLGERSLANWRAVSAKGASEVSFLTNSFCAYSAPVCWNILTQGVTLGYIPIGLSARLCDLQTFLLNCEGRFIVVLPPLVYFEMMYLVVDNSVNENNNESNRKHER